MFGFSSWLRTMQTESVKLETSVVGEKGRALWLCRGVQKTGQKPRLTHMEEGSR